MGKPELYPEVEEFNLDMMGHLGCWQHVSGKCPFARVSDLSAYRRLVPRGPSFCSDHEPFVGPIYKCNGTVRNELYRLQ